MILRMFLYILPVYFIIGIIIAVLVKCIYDKPCEMILDSLLIVQFLYIDDTVLARYSITIVVLIALTLLYNIEPIELGI